MGREEGQRKGRDPLFGYLRYIDNVYLEYNPVSFVILIIHVYIAEVRRREFLNNTTAAFYELSIQMCKFN